MPPLLPLTVQVSTVLAHSLLIEPVDLERRAYFPSCKNIASRNYRSEGKRICVQRSADYGNCRCAHSARRYSIETGDDTSVCRRYHLHYATCPTQHDEVRAGMESLVSGVETLRRARAVDVEQSAQVQATLERTLSVSSSLEARMEQAGDVSSPGKNCGYRSTFGEPTCFAASCAVERRTGQNNTTATTQPISTSATGADFNRRRNTSCYTNSERMSRRYQRPQRRRNIRPR